MTSSPTTATHRQCCTFVHGHDSLDACPLGPRSSFSASPPPPSSKQLLDAMPSLPFRQTAREKKNSPSTELSKRHPLTGAGHVVGPDESLLEGTTSLLVVCSTGCFQRPSFVRQLFEAEARGVVAIPIIADGSFQFPSDAMYQELLALSPRHFAGPWTRRHGPVRIDPLSPPRRDSHQRDVLKTLMVCWKVRASTIADRLSTFRRPLRLLASVKPSKPCSSIQRGLSR